MMDYPEDADLYGLPEQGGTIYWGIDLAALPDITVRGIIDEHGFRPMTDAEDSIRARRERAWFMLRDAFAEGQITVPPATDPIATYHANREAKAQRVAEEVAAAGTADDATVVHNPHLIGRSKPTVGIILTDDLPTLPPTALRTWEGWGG